MLILGRKKKSSSLKSTPNSSRQSSRKNSPRVSPVPVNLGKKRKREDSPVVEDKRLRRNAKSASKLVQDTSKGNIMKITAWHTFCGNDLHSFQYM